MSFINKSRLFALRVDTWLKFSPGCFTCLFKSLFTTGVPLLLRASNHQIVEKKN